MNALQKLMVVLLGSISTKKMRRAIMALGIYAVLGIIVNCSFTDTHNAWQCQCKLLGVGWVPYPNLVFWPVGLLKIQVEAAMVKSCAARNLGSAIENVSCTKQNTSPCSQLNDFHSDASFMVEDLDGGFIDASFPDGSFPDAGDLDDGGACTEPPVDMSDPATCDPNTQVCECVDHSSLSACAQCLQQAIQIGDQVVTCCTVLETCLKETGQVLSDTTQTNTCECRMACTGFGATADQCDMACVGQMTPLASTMYACALQMNCATVCDALRSGSQSSTSGGGGSFGGP